jgi:hypothetical protein
MPWYEVAETYETFIKNDHMRTSAVDEVWVADEDWCYPCQEPKEECYCEEKKEKVNDRIFR